MQSYEIKDTVTVEINALGESARFTFEPGTRKPKSEQEEAALRTIMESRPDLVTIKPPTARKTTRSKA